jgi:hypothetical protein
MTALQNAVTTLQAEVKALQAGAGAKVYSYSVDSLSIPGKTPDSIVGTLGPVPAGRYLLTARAGLYSPETDSVTWVCHLDADLAGNGSFTMVDFFYVDLQKDPGAANDGEVVLMTDVVFTNPGKVVMYCGEFFGGGPVASVFGVRLVAQQVL